MTDIYSNNFQPVITAEKLSLMLCFSTSFYLCCASNKK